MSKSVERFFVGMGKCTTLFIVVACTLSVVGIAVASSDYSQGVSFVENGGALIIPVAVLVQFLILAGYIGKTMQVLKYMQEDATKIEKAVERLTDTVVDHGERLSNHKARIIGLEKK